MAFRSCTQDLPKISPQSQKDVSLKSSTVSLKDLSMSNHLYSSSTNLQEVNSPSIRLCLDDESEVIRGSPYNSESMITLILKKTQRTYNEAVLLYKYLKTSSFFKRFKDENSSLRLTDALIHLSRNLKYHVFPPGSIIHRKGDRYNGRIYIVFSGKVALYEEKAQAESQIDSIKNWRSKFENTIHSQSQSNTGGSYFKEGFSTPKQIQTAKTEKFIPLERSGTVTESMLKSLNQNMSCVGKQLKKIVTTVRMNNKEVVKLQTITQELNKENQLLQKDKPKTPFKRSLTGVNVLSPKTVPESEKSVLSFSSKMKEATLTAELKVPANNEVKSKKTSFVLSEEEEDLSIEIEGDLNLEKKSSMDKQSGLKKARRLLKRSDTKTIVFDEKERSNMEDDMNSLQSIDYYMSHGREIKGLRQYVVRGETFGDEAIQNLRYFDDSRDIERRYTVEVGNQECELLSFCKEDLEYLYTRYEKSNTCVLDFLIDHVPNLEKILRDDKSFKIQELFTEENLAWHQNLTTQGQQGDKVYVLFDGVCEVLKEQINESSPKKGMLMGKDVPEKTLGKKLKNILVCLVKPGVFLGEEILFNESGNYEYTVKGGSTQSKILAIEKETFLKYIPISIQDELKKLYVKKAKHNLEIFAMKSKLQTSGVIQKSEIESSPSSQANENTTSNGKVPFHLKLGESRKIVQPKDAIKPRTITNDPHAYPDHYGLRMFAKENFNDIAEKRKPSLVWNMQKGEKVLKKLEKTHSKTASPKVDANDIKQFKFDFGKDSIDIYKLGKDIERQQDKEKKTFIELRRKISKENNTLDQNKPVLKHSSSLIPTPRSKFERVGTLGDLSLTPRKDTFRTSSSSNLKFSSSMRLEDSILTEKKEIFQRVVVEKNGRGYLFANEENKRPLKDEAREKYPLIEVSGKTVRAGKDNTTNSN